MGGVQVRHREHLVLQRADPHAPEVADLRGVPQHVAAFGPLLQVERRSSADQMQPHRRHFANAVHGTKFGKRSIQDATEIAEARKQLLGRLLHVRPRDGQGQQQFNHFMLGEPCQPALDEAFSQPLTVSLIVRQ